MIRADSGADSVVITNIKSNVTKARIFSKKLIVINNINSGERDFRCVIMRIVVLLYIEQQDRKKTWEYSGLLDKYVARIIGGSLWKKTKEMMWRKMIKRRTFGNIG